MTIVGLLALFEPVLLIGGSVIGYYVVRNAVKRSRQAVAERLIHELRKGHAR